MTRPDHSLSFAPPDARPARIVLDGTPYATDSMMRCPCGLIVVNYRDPDVRGAGSRSAHGLRFDSLAPITNARSVPACELSARSTQ
jgi:hypothetical protein